MRTESKLTKNTCVVRQRQFRMFDLEKRLWISDQSVLFPSGYPPHKIANLEIRVPGCYHLAYTKISQNLEGLYTGTAKIVRFPVERKIQ